MTEPKTGKEIAEEIRFHASLMFHAAVESLRLRQAVKWLQGRWKRVAFAAENWWADVCLPKDKMRVTDERVVDMRYVVATSIALHDDGSGRYDECVFFWGPGHQYPLNRPPGGHRVRETIAIVPTRLLTRKAWRLFGIRRDQYEQ